VLAEVKSSTPRVALENSKFSSGAANALSATAEHSSKLRGVVAADVVVVTAVVVVVGDCVGGAVEGSGVTVVVVLLGSSRHPQTQSSRR
jgi:hypothetical protein